MLIYILILILKIERIDYFKIYMVKLSKGAFLI